MSLIKGFGRVVLTNFARPAVQQSRSFNPMSWINKPAVPRHAKNDNFWGAWAYYWAFLFVTTYPTMRYCHFAMNRFERKRFIRAGKEEEFYL